MQPLAFCKMHGIGNDFAVLDAVRQPLPPDFSFSNLAQRCCARHTGVGADGCCCFRAASRARSDAHVESRRDGRYVRKRSALRGAPWPSARLLSVKTSKPKPWQHPHSAHRGDLVRVAWAAPLLKAAHDSVHLPPWRVAARLRSACRRRVLRAISLSTGVRRTPSCS
jgi:hypothetical protein